MGLTHKFHGENGGPKILSIVKKTQKNKCSNIYMPQTPPLQQMFVKDPL